MRTKLNVWNKEKYFAEYLESFFKDVNHSDPNIDNEKKIILNEFELYKIKRSGGFLEDFLHESFVELIKVKFSFAKDLHLFDIISSEFLTSETYFGKALIRFIIDQDIAFIVIAREWWHKDILYLHLYWEQHDEILNKQSDLLRNGYNLEELN